MSSLPADQRPAERLWVELVREW